MDSIDPKSAALVIQDLQNDVIIEGGAFADSGAPAHATSQNVVANVAGLAAACRKAGVPVIHVWYVVDEGAPGLKQNAPLFEGVKEANALVRGSWGAAPADGLEPQTGDHVVECAVPVRVAGLRAGKQLVPACKLGLRPLDLQDDWRVLHLKRPFTGRCDRFGNRR